MHPLLVVGFLACLAPAGNFAGEAPNARELSATEQKIVVDLAENALKARELWKGKIYLANAEVVLDNRATPPQRYALLTHYRYEGDLVIVSCVRLDKPAVVSVATHPHMPASLAPEEIAEAEKIARADPGVKKALAKYKHLDSIEADVMVAHTINPEVPGYQHRVARLFFRDAQRNYLQLVPMVDVDLTTGEVRLDVIAGTHSK
jgi:hypothetical protein